MIAWLDGGGIFASPSLTVVSSAIAKSGGNLQTPPRSEYPIAS